MTIEIRINDNGRHEVVKSMPMVLGTFVERAYAEMFVTALEAENDPSALPEFLEPVEPVAPASPQAVLAKAVSQSPSLPARSAAPLPTTEPAEADWNAALDRLEAGENCKAVAEDIGLPFGQLRAKWAGSVNSGRRKKPEPAAPKQTGRQRETEDSPTSGGVGAVLERGRRTSTWSAEDDEALINLEGADVLRFARDTGRSVAECDRRQRVLHEKIQRLMNED